MPLRGWALRGGGGVDRFTSCHGQLNITTDGLTVAGLELVGLLRARSIKTLLQVVCGLVQLERPAHIFGLARLEGTFSSAGGGVVGGGSGGGGGSGCRL